MRTFQIYTAEGMVHPEVKADYFSVDENSVIRFYRRPASRGESETCIAALVAGLDTLVMDVTREESGAHREIKIRTGV